MQATTIEATLFVEILDAKIEKIQDWDMITFGGYEPGRFKLYIKPGALEDLQTLITTYIKENQS